MADIISNIYRQSCSTGQLNKLAARVLKCWTKCAKCASF